MASFTLLEFEFSSQKNNKNGSDASADNNDNSEIFQVKLNQ